MEKDRLQRRAEEQQKQAEDSNTRAEGHFGGSHKNPIEGLKGQKKEFNMWRDPWLTQDRA